MHHSLMVLVWRYRCRIHCDNGLYKLANRYSYVSTNMKKQKYSYIVYYLKNKNLKKNKHHPEIRAKWLKDQITKECKKYQYELNANNELTCKIKQKQIKHIILSNNLPENKSEWIYGIHYKNEEETTFVTRIVPHEDQVQEIFKQVHLKDTNHGKYVNK